MAQIKQRTVEGQKVTLHKLKNPPVPDGKYEVRIDGVRDESARTKKQGMKLFRGTIDQIEKGAGSMDTGSSGGVIGLADPGQNPEDPLLNDDDSLF